MNRTVIAKGLSLAFSLSMLTLLVARAGITGCGGNSGPTAYPPATLPAIEAPRPKLEATDEDNAPLHSREPTFLPASKAGPPVLTRPVTSSSGTKPHAAPAGSGKH